MSRTIGRQWPHARGDYTEQCDRASENVLPVVPGSDLPDCRLAHAEFFSHGSLRAGGLTNGAHLFFGKLGCSHESTLCRSPAHVSVSCIFCGCAIGEVDRIAAAREIAGMQNVHGWPISMAQVEGYLVRPDSLAIEREETIAVLVCAGYPAPAGEVSSDVDLVPEASYVSPRHFSNHRAITVQGVCR